VKESLSRLLQKMQNLRRCRISENADYLEKKLLTNWKQVLRKLGKLSLTTVSGDNIILRLSENPWNRRYEPCPCLPDTRKLSGGKGRDMRDLKLKENSLRLLKLSYER
jgi:hypothetical protein